MRRMPLPLPFRSRPLWLVVILILSSLLTLPLAVVGCGPGSASNVLGAQVTVPPGAGRTASPTRATAALPLVVPGGWTQVLPGLILSDFSHFNTLVISAAKPGRIAACALPPHAWPVTVAPVLVVSDD